MIVVKSLSLVLVFFGALAEDRLSDFIDHKLKVERFDQNRDSAAEEVKAAKKKWEEEKQSALEKHRAQKKLQNAATDETSSDYQKDLSYRRDQKKKYEEMQRAYSQEKKRKIKLGEGQEIDEFGLTVPRPRVQAGKRSLFGKPGSGRSSGFNSNYGGGGEGAYTPPAPPSGGYTPPEFSQGDAPPPTPSGSVSEAPDFYEPPVPAMDDGGVGDEVPPPVFEDNDF